MDEITAPVSYVNAAGAQRMLVLGDPRRALVKEQSSR